MLGNATEALLSQARYADVLVVEQYDANRASSDPAGHLAEDIAMLSARPVLTTPVVGPHVEFGLRILIARNGCREVAPATHDALPFLAAADSVVVLTVDETDDNHGSGADIAAHLARHGGNVDLHNRTSARHPPTQARHPTKLSVGEVIQPEAATKSPLLVFADTAHRPSSEFFNSLNYMRTFGNFD